MIRTPSASKLENLLTGHSDCIISVRLSLRNVQHATLFSVFAPTLQAEPAENDKFYPDLQGVLQSTSADNKVIIFGDFNARVGQHGSGKWNDSGHLLLEFGAEQLHVITNTIFHHKDKQKGNSEYSLDAS